MMGKKAELEKRVTSLERLEEARAVNLHSDDCPCTSCRVRREDLARFYALSRRVEDLERVTRQGLQHAAPRPDPNAAAGTAADECSTFFSAEACRARDRDALYRAFQAAGEVIALRDSADYLTGLWNVIRSIRPDIADAENPEDELYRAVFPDDEG